MAFTADDVARLEAAIARGVRSVRNANGEQVEYASMTELREALAAARAEVGGSGGGFGVIYPTTGRGL